MKRIFILFIMLTFIASPALAASFDAGYIISDEEMNKSEAMSLTDINKFLNQHTGILNGYFTADKNGIVKSAAEIIYNASREFGINPKFILVSLQKEQSLIDNPTPSANSLDYATGYGVCDSCNYDDPVAKKNRGFGKQVDALAASMRWYFENANNGWLKRVGQIYKIDKELVLLMSQATANLYNYTPHISGNYNFWKIWQSWFMQSYPDGSLLKLSGTDDIYLIQNGQKRKFLNKVVFFSQYDMKQVIEAPKADLDKYELGAPIKYVNYSLLVSPLGTKYMLQNDKLRPFESELVIKTIGFNPEEFEKIDFDDFKYFEFGPTITLSDSYPSGALLQDKASGGVYFVQNGNKYPILTKVIMQLNFPSYKIIKVTSAELDKYPRFEPVKLKDGLLIKEQGKQHVYFTSNGTKRPIASGEAFEKLGFKWNNVIELDEKSLSNIPDGAYIDYKE